MKRTLLLTFLLCPLFLFSQLVENNSFEEWEEISETNSNLEPIDWSSIQTGEPEGIAGLAAQVLHQSSDAYSGDFSLRLKSVYIAIADEVANGLATNGRVHLDLNAENGYVFTDTNDDKWYTECLTRPDSIVGYYKYIPQENDITTVQALVHTGSAKIPDLDSAGWIGMATYNSPSETTIGWVRFSAPFEYFSEEDPEYILLNISSGDGLNAVEGSEAWYDDIELIYNPVGVNENAALELIDIYSNLNKEIIVDLSSFSRGASWEINLYNLNGQLVNRFPGESGQIHNLNTQNEGIFIVQVIDKEGFSISKKVAVF